MTAQEITCRYSDADGNNCAAQFGEPCQWLPSGEFHAERIEDAAACMVVADPVTQEAFDRAAEKSGLF